ncbi:MULTISPECIES: methyltransferase domain-containing protein [unclassified Chryseobacterium]|uniref:methyltransferase domain-containing protein n=1 Tax=unclassified Chryseobacterium TaxID=2593645 RepID=UPI000D394182|nr:MULTISPECIES: class I SAM-dependent methyltransferase [unclassified Chryseobacterium]PTT72598.1 hypothetical protein DBR25_14345 [Chryseobacterium sp. HMWF001]PVV50419.1 class I SAM-dependent methyltransferase [Chryseobacterium sp. HMWF035]
MIFELTDKEDFKRKNMVSWETNSSFILKTDFNHEFRSFLEKKLAEIVNTEKEAGLLLDVGCGSGWLTEIVPESVEYMGIDNCVSFVSSLNHKESNHFFELDIELNHKSEKLQTYASNIVICCMSLLEMPYLENVFENLSMVTKKNGLLLIIGLNPFVELLRILGHDKKNEYIFNKYRDAKNPLCISKKIQIESEESSSDYYRILYSFEDYFTEAKKRGFILEEYKEDINMKNRDISQPMYEFFMFRKL